MKNVIAYSLWGDLPMYWIGAVRNIELALMYYPDFICRFYIDRNCKVELISTLKGRKNVEIFLVDSKDEYHGMFWRFWAAEDPEVNVFLSRDCDSRFSEREASAVREWLNSDKDFHIIRDHPYHNVPVLGGMWGCRNGILRDIGISKLIKDWGKYERKGIDQEFLAQVVYPLVKDRTMEHSEFGIKFGNEIRPIPGERLDYEFIGDVFDENDVRNPDFWKIIKKHLD